MGEVNHENRKHALLSASGASRWLACTPSARLEEKFQESGNSSYAEEGTLAHEFGDINLRYILGELPEKSYKAELKKLRSNKLYSLEMEPEVDKYINAVMESYNVARAKTKDAKLLIEARLDFSHLVEKGFGTGDACIIADRVLEIIDLKYGKGVVVDAEDNSQLKLYGIGALEAFEMMYDIDTIKLTIVQPRLDSISSWEISVADLRAWGENVVRPKALEAYKGEGEQCAGSWCKFCKVKPMCKTLAAKNMELAKHEFADPQLLSEEELLGIFKQQPMLVDWVNAVSQYLLDEAIKGKSWADYKLVEGRSQRRWENESLVGETLLKNGFTEGQIYLSSLNPITKMEKIVDKVKFAALLNPLIIKPSGKPTLVPLADKRPAMGIDQARKDFAEEEDLL